MLTWLGPPQTRGKGGRPTAPGQTLPSLHGERRVELKPYSHTPDDAGRALPCPPGCPGPHQLFSDRPMHECASPRRPLPARSGPPRPDAPCDLHGEFKGPVGPGPQASSRKARLPQRENDDDAAPTSADIGQTRARSVRGPNAPLPCAKSERGRRRLPSSPEAELRDAMRCSADTASPTSPFARGLASPLDDAHTLSTPSPNPPSASRHGVPSVLFRRRGPHAFENLVTAFVPSDTACFANSPGNTRRMAV